MLRLALRTRHAMLAALGSLTLLAATAAAAAAAADAAVDRSAFNGIWSGDQGVLWDTTVKPGEKTRAPFTPEYAARYQRSLEASARGKPMADPTTACLPPGVPRILASPFPFEVVVTPQTVFVLYEYMSQVRRIHLEGSGPAPLGMATFNGHSTGRWEGDVLVIDTIELNPKSVLDTTHFPHSEQLRVVERMRVVAKDKLEISITLHDPKALTVPWTVVRTYSRRAGERVLEYVCAENNRNPVNPDGTTGFTGAP
jgi:hypothetical protein